MEIGKPQRVETDVPRPRRAEPIKPLPEREPVYVPRKEPVREPAKRYAFIPGITVEALRNECSVCGRPLEMYDGEEYRALVCPQHGVVQEL